MANKVVEAECDSYMSARWTGEAAFQAADKAWLGMGLDWVGVLLGRCDIWGGVFFWGLDPKDMAAFLCGFP